MNKGRQRVEKKGRNGFRENLCEVQQDLQAALKARLSVMVINVTLSMAGCSCVFPLPCLDRDSVLLNHVAVIMTCFVFFRFYHH